MSRHRPKPMFFGIALLLAVAISILLWRLDLTPAYAYLAGINIVTFSLYGYDKRQAVASQERVPELILHMVTLAGGSPAALLGQMAFRHKTRKFKFQIVFVAIITTQCLTAFGYWYAVLRTA